MLSNEQDKMIAKKCLYLVSALKFLSGNLSIKNLNDIFRI